MELNKVYNMDCLEGMELIAEKSIDMILCDLPYGTTKNRWDVVIPLELLWRAYERIIKDHGCIALFSAQPFTTDLINSNRKLFRYDLVWNKVLPTGFLNANRMPLRVHETVCIFYKKLPVYHPQMIVRGPLRDKGRKKDMIADGDTCYGNYQANQSRNNEYYPTSIWTFSNGNRTHGRIHSTQKPIAVLEQLILTYTDRGDVVLDHCAGSCSTGIACHNTGRKFIGMEKDPKIYEMGNASYENEKKRFNMYDMMIPGQKESQDPG